MITSPSNPRLRLLRRLHSRRQRERLGLFACEGEDLVEAALDAGLAPVEVVVDAERPALADRLPDAEPGYTYPADAPWLRLDYAFASPDLAPRLAACDVVANDLAARASDHLPLVVELRP